jgi:TonB family protein
VLNLRFSRLQVALFLSLALHFLFLISFSPRIKTLSKHPSTVTDYHLLVDVELVPPTKHTVEMEKPLKAVADIPKSALMPKSKGETDSFDSTTTTKSPQKKSPINNRFNKNELVSFSKSYSPSSKSWNRAPVYPDSARRLGREGRVILEAQLNDVGKVVSVQVARSSGSGDLDQAAIDAVRNWTMDLPSDGSKRLFIPITFRFNSNS